MLFTDDFGAAPYYGNAGTYDRVIVYKDRTMEVSRGLITAYRNRNYQTDFTDIIESVDDDQGAYNCTEKRKEKRTAE